MSLFENPLYQSLKNYEKLGLFISEFFITCIIFIMSIDILGRLFRQAGNYNRVSPGIGFKVTNSGNFDLDGNSLCNVAGAEESNDAVNLQLVLDLIKK